MAKSTDRKHSKKGHGKFQQIFISNYTLFRVIQLVLLCSWLWLSTKRIRKFNRRILISWHVLGSLLWLPGVFPYTENVTGNRIMKGENIIPVTASASQTSTECTTNYKSRQWIQKAENNQKFLYLKETLFQLHETITFFSQQKYKWLIRSPVIINLGILTTCYNSHIAAFFHLTPLRGAWWLTFPPCSRTL